MPPADAATATPPASEPPDATTNTTDPGAAVDRAAADSPERVAPGFPGVAAAAPAPAERKRVYTLPAKPGAKDSAAPSARRRQAKAPRTSITKVAAELTKYAPSRADLLETLAPGMGRTLPVAPESVDGWARRLHDQRILLLSCIDREVLTSIARAVPRHALFAAMQPFEVSRQRVVSVWEIVGAALAEPSVVVSYAVGPSGEGWIKNFPGDPFDVESLHAQLLRSKMWLLTLTTPDTAQRAGVALDGTWIDRDVDFIGPRLQAALGADAVSLTSQFRRQRTDGRWGASDAETLRLISDALAQNELGDRINLYAGAGGAAPLRQTPDWDALLAAPAIAERALNELILFIAAFFRGREETGDEGLSVNAFQNLVRSLIPIVAADTIGQLPPGEPTGADQMNRLWVTQGERLRSACGLNIVRASSGATIVRFADTSWRDDVSSLLLSGQYWLFTRLATATRRRDHLFGADEIAQGTMRVAAAQSIAGSVLEPDQILAWIAAAADDRPQPTAPSVPLRQALADLSDPDCQALAAWIAGVLRETQEPASAPALLGTLMAVGAHVLAGRVLRQCWGVGGFAPGCLSVARRLMNEAPADVRADVLGQVHSALHRGDVSLAELSQQDWIGDAESSGASLGAAQLLVEIFESSIGGLNRDRPVRRALADGQPAQLRALVSWLWHAAVTGVLDKRVHVIAALPALWILPQDVRRTALEISWEASERVIDGWWDGFGEGLGEGGLADPDLPLVFRTLALAEWAGSADHEASVDTLAGVLDVLPRTEIRRVRLYLKALDAGLGQVLRMLLAGGIVDAPARRTVEARIRPLRDRIRRLRDGLSATARP